MEGFDASTRRTCSAATAPAAASTGRVSPAAGHSQCSRQGATGLISAPRPPRVTPPPASAVGVSTVSSDRWMLSEIRRQGADPGAQPSSPMPTQLVEVPEIEGPLLLSRCRSRVRRRRRCIQRSASLRIAGQQRQRRLKRARPLEREAVNARRHVSPFLLRIERRINRAEDRRVTGAAAQISRERGLDVVRRCARASAAPRP